MPTPVKFLPFTEFGAIGTGLVDDSGAINNAIITAKAMADANPGSRYVVLGTSGRYRCSLPIRPLSKVDVFCTPDCIFERTTNVPNNAEGFVSFDDVTDVSWTGGLFLRAAEGIKGTVFGIKGNRITVRDAVVSGWQPGMGTFVTGWSGGRAFAVRGDYITLINPTCRDPFIDMSMDQMEAAGGVRVFSGRGFRCHGGYLESGDDAMAFAPTAVGTSGNMDGTASIEDGIFMGVVAYGKGARVINVGLSASDMSGTWPSSGLFRLTSRIRNVKFIAITALSTANRCVLIRNGTSSGVIEDVDLTDVNVRSEDATPMDTDTRWVVVANAAGGVRNVRFTSVSVFGSPVAPALAPQPVEIDGVDGFYWIGGHIGAPEPAGQAAVRLRGVVGGALRDLSIGCNGFDGVLLEKSNPPTPNDFGLVSRDCRDVVIERGVIEDVPAAGFGVRCRYALNCGARDLRFTPALSATVTLVAGGGTLTVHSVRAPAVTGEYSVRADSAVVYRLQRKLGEMTNAAVSQGIVGVLLEAGGFKLTLTGAVTSATQFKVVVAAATTAKAVELPDTATACFAEACNLSGLATGAVVLVSGHGHREANNYTPP